MHVHSLTYPQIPVLFMATVISPGFKLSPFSTSSCVGTASATQRSCAGFVYTPMLAFAGWTAVAVVVVDILFLLQQGASHSMGRNGRVCPRKEVVWKTISPCVQTVDLMWAQHVSKEAFCRC
jgi:hypothetical protein